MIEDDLRASFERHAHLAPHAATVRQAIEAGYRQRQRHRIGLRGAGAAVAVAALAAVPAVAIHAVRTPATPATAPAGQVAGSPDPLAGKPLNLLVLGLDGTPAQLGTVLIAHISADRGHAYLITLPVTTRVAGGRSLLDDYASGARAGSRFAAVARSLGSVAGVRFDAGATFTPDAVAGLVDALHGIDLSVDQKTVSVYLGTAADGTPAAPYEWSADGRPLRRVPGVTPDVYPVGQHHFSGRQAADYLRQRLLLPHGRIDQERHERQFVAALWRALRRPGAPDPAALVAAAGDGLVLDSGGLPLAGFLTALDGIRDVTGLGLPVTEAPQPRLDGAATQVLHALAADDLDSWVRAHPGAIDATR